MTTGCNIFKDKTPMPDHAHDELDDITRTRMTGSAAGAMATHTTKPEGMNVANLQRPRRGHDY